MCDGELREGISNENEGEHTPADAVTCITARAGDAAMPPRHGNASAASAGALGLTEEAET
jgi:hypothetical protein